MCYPIKLKDNDITLPPVGNIIKEIRHLEAIPRLPTSLTEAGKLYRAHTLSGTVPKCRHHPSIFEVSYSKQWLFRTYSGTPFSTQPSETGTYKSQKIENSACEHSTSEEIITQVSCTLQTYSISIIFHTTGDEETTIIGERRAS